MTDVAYRQLTLAEKIFKDLVWDTAVRVGEGALETNVPFFALPVIRNVEEATLDALSNWLYAKFCMQVDVGAIKLVNALHQAAYDSASIGLKVIAHDKGVDSDEFKVAREKAKADLSRFTNLAGGQ